MAACEGMSVREQLEYAIGGVTVQFPCKPYRTQMAMMAKIITALSRQENALLESPTGSGKSLALLCAALAWQRAEHMKRGSPVAADPGPPQEITCSCDCHDRPESCERPNPSLVPASIHPALSEVKRGTMEETSLRTTVDGHRPGIVKVEGTSVVTTEEPRAIKTEECCAVTAEIPCTVKLEGGRAVKLEGDRAVKLEGDRAVKLEGGRAVKAEAQSTVKEERWDGGKMEEGGGEKVDAGEPGGGKGGEGGGVGMDDSLEEDFKQPKKRFRTPSAAGPTMKKRRRKVKGVEYEDTEDVEDAASSEGGAGPSAGDEAGPPSWKMELKSPALGGLGVAPSQIMDTGTAVKTEDVVGGCGQPASHTPCTKCNCPSPDRPAKFSPIPTAGGKNPAGSHQSKVPKIYFGSRTHKQIAQLTHELAKTAYTGVHMTILASREHTCIHPNVSKSRSKNDDCSKLLRNRSDSCGFFHRVQKKLGCQAHLRRYGYNTAWDIEDLVQLGHKTMACPYYATRSLLEEADIVFCPYNYLIDPNIREQMLVNLQDQIVIFDEGHNMEDSAREAASLTVNTIQLDDTLKELTELMEYCLGNDALKPLAGSYQFFVALTQNLFQWIERTAQNLPQRSYEQACGIWSGEDFVPVLHQMGISPHTYPIISKHLQTIASPSVDDEEVDPPILSMASLAILKNLCIVLTYMFKEGMRFVHDYRISVMKVSTSRTKDPMVNGWRRRGPRVLEKVWMNSLNFWCLNPAVAFSELSCTRSIILTSGTLSPVSSFSSELGVSFPIQLEANHVIPETQTWIRTISHGPSGNSLLANYQNSETYEFQDEVGLVVLRACQTVPYGVLCFLSSYKMLQKLSKRWQDTGLWGKIIEKKCIVSEPRSGEKADFEEAMHTFYQVVRECHGDTGLGDGRTGALFLAVCRGKVSEGLDFANDNARAVITVGIPFPNIKDKQVELKREYNNEHCRKRGVLTGSEWYEIQAYRALNQALGRCLRHLRDWGALILVDERFSKGPHYTKGLSKWVRQRVKHERNFEEAMSSLKAFAEERIRACTNGSAADKTCDESSASINITADQPSTSTTFTSPSRPPLPSPLLPITPSHSPLGLPHASTPIASDRMVRVLPPSIVSPQHPSHLPPLFKTPSSPFPLPSMTPYHPAVAPTQLTLEEALLQQSTALLALSASGSAHHPASSTHHPARSTHHPASSTHHSAGCSAISLGSSAHYHVSSAHHTANSTHHTASSTHYPASSTHHTASSTHRPTFLYPGGVQIASPVQPVSLSNSTNLSTCLPTVGTTGTSVEPVGPVQRDSPDLPVGGRAVEAHPVPRNNLEKPRVSESPPISSPAAESPLLFDSCPTSPAPQQTVAAQTVHQPTLQPASESLQPASESLQPTSESPSVPHQSLDPGRKSAVPQEERDGVDNDQTPPLSPHQPAAESEVEQNLQRTPVPPPIPHPTPVPHPTPKTTATSFGQPRTRNIRLAKRRGAVAGVKTAVVAMEEDEDFSSGRGKTPRTRRQVKAITADCTAVITCCCGQPVTTASEVGSIELKEALSRRFARHRVAAIQGSRLWTLLRGKPKARTLNVFLVSGKAVCCEAEEGQGGYNAVWDCSVGLCYSHLVCACGEVVGAQVHAEDGVDGLKGKALISVEKTNSSCSNHPPP